MRYGHVFPVAVSGEQQITSFCAPQWTDAEIPAAVQSGGYARAVNNRTLARLASGERRPVCIFMRWPARPGMHAHAAMRYAGIIERW